MSEEAIETITDTSVRVLSCLKQWQEVNLLNLRYSLDEQAFLIAEGREEYVGRRKALAAKVRGFLSSCELESESLVVTQANALIEAFKVEFDFLSKLCKLSEGSFLSLHKLLRDVQDPVETLLAASQCLEFAKAALQEAADHVTKSLQSNTTTNSSLGDLRGEDAFAERLQQEVCDMKFQYARDLHSLENSLKLNYEKTLLEAQQKYEQLIAQRESEISSLQQIVEEYTAHDYNTLYESERRKLMKLEEDHRSQQQLHNTLQAELESLQETTRRDRNLVMKLQQDIERISCEKKEEQDAYESRISALNDDIANLITELASRPSMPISALISSISAYDIDESLVMCHSWNEFPSALASVLRSLNSISSQLRYEKSALEETTRAQSIKLTALDSQVTQQSTLISRLENDLAEKTSDRPLEMSSTSGMLQSLVEQRDRILATANAHEAENISLKRRIEQLLEENGSKQAENVELYKRLRSTRLQGDNTEHKGLQKRHVRAVDDIEMKYSGYYEESLDPFRLTDFDRKMLISRMNIFEKLLAQVAKFLLQDSWTRRALLLYLCLVHIFAIGYVIIVLNPELESDMHGYDVNHQSGKSSGVWGDIHPDIAS